MQELCLEGPFESLGLDERGEKTWDPGELTQQKSSSRMVNVGKCKVEMYVNVWVIKRSLGRSWYINIRNRPWIRHGKRNVPLRCFEGPPSKDGAST